jgi:hypothetical protein
MSAFVAWLPREALIVEVYMISEVVDRDTSQFHVFLVDAQSLVICDALDELMCGHHVLSKGFSIGFAGGGFNIAISGGGNDVTERESFTAVEKEEGGMQGDF